MDWVKIKALDHNHTYVRTIVDDVDGYKDAIDNNKQKLASLYRERALKTCARTAKSSILQEQVNKLDLAFGGQVKTLAKTHSFSKELGLNHSHDLDL